MNILGHVLTWLAICYLAYLVWDYHMYTEKLRQCIPPEVLSRLRGVVLEGQKVYGTWDNWKTRYAEADGQLERLIHADNHWRRWKEGDTSEDNLAKVMWFCMMMLWFQENGKDHITPKA